MHVPGGEKEEPCRVERISMGTNINWRLLYVYGQQQHSGLNNSKQLIYISIQVFYIYLTLELEELVELEVRSNTYTWTQNQGHRLHP